MAAFAADAMLHDAVVRNLEIISEASRFLADDVRTLEPGIPWRGNRGRAGHVLPRRMTTHPGEIPTVEQLPPRVMFRPEETYETPIKLQ